MSTAHVADATGQWDADEAVTQLYTAHYRSLVRLSALMLRDSAVAEEVVQDAFVAMHGRWRKLRDPDKALAYLRQSVANGSRSVLRRRKVADRHLSRQPSPTAVASAEHGVMATVRVRRGPGRARQLPERQRETLVLRYYGDLSEADIATTMGISRGAVKSHASRGMAALRTTLERVRMTGRHADDGDPRLAEALRRALARGAADIHPLGDGLTKIRARTAATRRQRWLVPVPRRHCASSSAGGVAWAAGALGTATGDPFAGQPPHRGDEPDGHDAPRYHGHPEVRARPSPPRTDRRPSRSTTSALSPARATGSRCTRCSASTIGCPRPTRRTARSGWRQRWNEMFANEPLDVDYFGRWPDAAEVLDVTVDEDSAVVTVDLSGSSGPTSGCLTAASHPRSAGRSSSNSSTPRPVPRPRSRPMTSSRRLTYGCSSTASRSTRCSASTRAA